jgi:hypothetical protein
MNLSKRIFRPASTLCMASAMLFSASLWPPVQARVRPKSKAAAPISISITLTFGRAKKKCGGFGICKITIGKLTAANARTVEAELSQVSGGRLELTLLGSPPEEGRTLFIDEDIPLSSDSAKRLGFRTATIKRGQYAFRGNKSVLNARLTRSANRQTQ